MSSTGAKKPVRRKVLKRTDYTVDQLASLNPAYWALLRHLILPNGPFV